MRFAEPFKLIQKRNLWFVISVCLITVGLGLMAVRAVGDKPVLNFGIDFTGGTSFIVKFDALNARLLDAPNASNEKIAFITELRGVLTAFGLEKSQIQITQDKAVIIRTEALNNERRLDVLRTMEERIGVMELLEVDVIGPTIGQELKEQSLWIILFVSIALLIYITWRFELVFGAAALLAVLHDALIIISFSSITWLEVNTVYVAALLTVLGYSINDTIVIFDRIREQIGAKGNKLSLDQLINMAVTDMFSRSVHTSTTTLIVVGALFVFGGATIKTFTMVLLVGIVSGTYSSIFVASPLLYVMYPRLGKDAQH